MIERFARSVVVYRSRWTVGVLIVLALAAIASSRLRIRNLASDFLPRGSGASSPVESAIRSRIGGGDQIVVLVDGAQPEQLDTMAAALGRIPGIRRVQYRLRPEYRSFLQQAAPQFLPALIDTLQLAGLRRRISAEHIREALGPRADSLRRVLASIGIPGSDPLGILGPVAGLLERSIGGGLIRLSDGYFTLAGSRTFLMVLEPDQSLGDLDQARKVTETIQQVLRARSPPGVTTTAVGRPFTFLRSVETTIGDGARIAALAGIATFLLLFLFFRRPLAPLLLVGVVGYGLLVTGAFVAVLAGGVGIVVWLFVALLVGLGDEFAFYIASHYWISGDPAASREWNLAEAIRKPLRGLLLSGFAMASAFLALLVVSYPIMMQLAWITALGLLALMATAFVVLPVGLAYTEPGNLLTTRTWSLVARLLEPASRFPTAGVLAWLAVLGAGAVLAAGVSVELHPWKVALRNNPATQEMERARARLRFWPSPLLMVSEGSTAEAALGKDREALRALDIVGGRAGVVWVESLSRLLPPMDTQQVSINYVRARAADFDAARFRREYTRQGGDPAYAEQVSRLLDPDPKPVTLERLRRLGLDSLVDRHVIESQGRYLAISYLYLEQFPWAGGVIPRFESTMRLREYPALQQARFVGDALRGSLHADRLKRESLRATGLAFLLVGGLLGFRFRRPLPVLLCLVPLVAGILGGLAVMRVMGIELNVLTLGAAPILVGLCVDDGIHIVEGLGRGQTAAQVLRDSGAAMIVTTLTTIAAALCLGLATFEGVREVGLVVAAGLILALLASLHLLPLIWRLASPRKR